MSSIFNRLRHCCKRKIKVGFVLMKCAVWPVKQHSTISFRENSRAWQEKRSMWEKKGKGRGWCWSRLIFFEGIVGLYEIQISSDYSVDSGLPRVFLGQCKSPLMKLNKTCFIITQLPRALVHSGSDVDYHVARWITGTSVAAPVLPYTHCQEGDVWCYTS